MEHSTFPALNSTGRAFIGDTMKAQGCSCLRA
jgi:hypothetical protein